MVSKQKIISKMFFNYKIKNLPKIFLRNSTCYTSKSLKKKDFKSKPIKPSYHFSS
jgi:hypothetical protein